MERLNFPEVSDASIAFCSYPKDWFDEILEKGKKRFEEIKPYRDLMETLFFEGGKIPINKKLDISYLDKGSRILKAVMGSWSPKHEHKEIVCGMILESLCYVEKRSFIDKIKNFLFKK